MASSAPRTGRAWVFSLAFLGFAGGIAYNYRYPVVARVTACTHAAQEHLWDALCLAMAMAAILTGLLAGKAGGSSEDNHPTYGFFDHIMLGLPERDACAIDAQEEDDRTRRCADDHQSSIAFPAYEVSIARTQETSTTTRNRTDRPPACSNDASSIACRDLHSFVACSDQASIACNHQISVPGQHNTCFNQLFMIGSGAYQSEFCNAIEASMACSCVKRKTQPAGVHRATPKKIKQYSGDDSIKEIDFPKLLEHATSSPGGVSADDSGEVKLLQEMKLGYGVHTVQEMKLGYGVQEMQGHNRCTPVPPAASDLQVEDDEYSLANLMECAELSRKADAFIASFREQMRREMMCDMMLCT